MTPGEITSGPLGTHKIDTRRVMFTPLEDITAFELARCIILMEYMRNSLLLDRLAALRASQSEVARHFEIQELEG